MTTTPPPLPTDDRKPAWRAACLAYREARRAGIGDLESSRVAVAAMQAVWALSDKEAEIEARDAIAYASNNHTKWFWSGVGGRANSG